MKRKRGRPRLEAPYLNRKEPVTSSGRDLSTRKSQLEKNRVAADKCRRQRKDYTSKLLDQHTSLSAKNEALKADVATLREQLLNLKHEILGHAGCGSRFIDSYVTRTAGSIGNVGGDVWTSKSEISVENPHTPLLTDDTGETGSDDTPGSHPCSMDADHGAALSDYDDHWFFDHDPVTDE